MRTNMVNEVGILTVARYLREGVCDGVRCFVDTKYGLREFTSVVGMPGAMRAILKIRNRFWSMGQPQTPVRLDTEIFLAKRDLAGMPRSEVILIAERAASVDALVTRSQQVFSGSLPLMDVPHSCANTPKLIEAEGAALPSSVWQG